MRSKPDLPSFESTGALDLMKAGATYAQVIGEVHSILAMRTLSIIGSLSGPSTAVLKSVAESQYALARGALSQIKSVDERPDAGKDRVA